MSESLEGPQGLEIVVGPGDSRGPEDLRGLRCLTIPNHWIYKITLFFLDTNE